jgi:hypothetical protein
VLKKLWRKVRQQDRVDELAMRSESAVRQLADVRHDRDNLRNEVVPLRQTASDYKQMRDELYHMGLLDGEHVNVRKLSRVPSEYRFPVMSSLPDLLLNPKVDVVLDNRSDTVGYRRERLCLFVDVGLTGKPFGVSPSAIAETMYESHIKKALQSFLEKKEAETLGTISKED